MLKWQYFGRTEMGVLLKLFLSTLTGSPETSGFRCVQNLSVGPRGRLRRTWKGLTGTKGEEHPAGHTQLISFQKPQGLKNSALQHRP